MAKIHREACFYKENLDTSWQGNGWAKIPFDWLWSNQHEFGWVVILGKIRLRIIKTCHPWDFNVYVVKDNWRWPYWWVLLRLWLALCWFERKADGLVRKKTIRLPDAREKDSVRTG